MLFACRVSVHSGPAIGGQTFLGCNGVGLMTELKVLLDELFSEKCRFEDGVLSGTGVSGRHRSAE